jgi:hypothetical protein
MWTPLRHTDFSKYSHAQLYAMLHAGVPARARSAAESWDALGAKLHEQAGNLEARLLRFRDQWRGGAAEQYVVMITDLHTGLRRVGNTAFAMRDIAHDCADVLTWAQSQMPAPVDVPEVPAPVVRLATVPVQLDPTASPEAVMRLRQQQAQAMAEMRARDQVAQVSGAAHARAVAVMNELATHYDYAGARIPFGTVRPNLQKPDSTVDVGWGDQRGIIGQQGTPKNPLFGNMFTAGLLAASAATAGRFGTTVPRVPIWAEKKVEPTEKPAEAGPLPELDSFGGGGGGFGGGGGIGSIGSSLPAGQPPAAHTGMIGTPGGSSGLAAGAIGGAAGAAVGTGMGMMPMMPMMPMGGMHGDQGGGRRVPPWLVETEEIWGERTVVAPPVIGDDLRGA